VRAGERGRDRRPGDRRIAAIARRTRRNRAERRVVHVEQHVVQRHLAGGVEHLPADRRSGAGGALARLVQLALEARARTRTGRRTDVVGPAGHAVVAGAAVDAAAAVVPDDAAVLPAHRLAVEAIRAGRRGDAANARDAGAPAGLGRGAGLAVERSAAAVADLAAVLT